MKIQTSTRDAYSLLHNGALALARAERQGICIDVNYCESKTKHLTRKIRHLTDKLKQTDFYKTWKKEYGEKTNIGSNHQLARILYDIKGYTPARNTESGGQGATDKPALEQLNVKELDYILKIRKLKKIRDTYLGSFTEEQYGGIIHPFFNLHTVRTFRSSSDRPNFQNIPKRDKESKKITRKALRPRPGHMFIEADFSSLEVSISACYHKDPVMIKYLNDPDSDMHLDMAKQIFIFDHLDKKIPEHHTLRQAAKNGFVFSQFYGDYYYNNAVSLAKWIELPQEGLWKKHTGMKLNDDTYISDHFRSKGIKSFEKFADHMKEVEDDFWNRRFKVYNQWRKNWIRKYKKKGFFKMHTGFVCKGVMKDNEVINYPVQGSAFHCLLWTFIHVDEAIRKEKWDSKLVGQIHDSVVLDVHPDELEMVKRRLHEITEVELPKAWRWIIVPLSIDIDEYGIDEPWVA